MTSHQAPSATAVTAGEQAGSVVAPSGWGTQRRLRALMNRAWAPEIIERVTGIPQAQIITALARRTAITPDLAQRVAAAYDQLWDRPPPRTTPRDVAFAHSAQELARQGGWPPPMAYDDDLIDLPEGGPEPGWQPTGRTTRKAADLAEDIAWIREHGGYRRAPAALLAMRLGVSRTALEQAQCRTNRAAREAEAS
jgi:hypothetical protein